jgi:hypothetical protein
MEEAVLCRATNIIDFPREPEFEKIMLSAQKLKVSVRKLHKLQGSGRMQVAPRRRVG